MTYRHPLQKGLRFDAAELVLWDREVLSAILAAPEEVSDLLDRISEDEISAEPAKAILRAAKSLIALKSYQVWLPCSSNYQRLNSMGCSTTG